MRLLELAAVAATALAQLAPLEPADNSRVHFGAWYNYYEGDSPKSINSRLAYQPMSFFQADFDLNGDAEYFNSSNHIGHTMEAFFNKIEETGSDAFPYLTLYPMEGFDQVTDKILDDVCERLARVVKSGRKILIRYAPEMNGNWFPKYARRPEEFKKSWIRLVNKVHSAVSKDQVAFLWAPNSGNNYPWGGDVTTTFAKELDTNNNGTLDTMDDPYSPYYPGDEYVDWIYYYGAWNQTIGGQSGNTLADPKYVEQIISGAPNMTERPKYDFYRMFSGDGQGSPSKGGKPFIISETGSTIHLAENRLPTDQFVPGSESKCEDKNPAHWTIPENANVEFKIQQKRQWWKQFFNREFMAKYPKFKAVGLFEFVKCEEASWRDFTILGKGAVTDTPLQKDVEAANGPVLAAFQADIKESIGDMVLWAKTDATKTRIVDKSAPAAATPTGSATNLIPSIAIVAIIMSLL